MNHNSVDLRLTHETVMGPLDDSKDWDSSMYLRLDTVNVIARNRAAPSPITLASGPCVSHEPKGGKILILSRTIYQHPNIEQAPLLITLISSSPENRDCTTSLGGQVCQCGWHLFSWAVL